MSDFLRFYPGWRQKSWRNREPPMQLLPPVLWPAIYGRRNRGQPMQPPATRPVAGHLWPAQPRAAYAAAAIRTVAGHLWPAQPRAAYAAAAIRPVAGHLWPA